MKRSLAACETAMTVALGLWLGAVVMTGATAAVAFPTMRDLAPTLPGYALYTGEHWSLAAGRVMARVFLVCDAIQFASLAVMLLALGAAALLFGAPLRGIGARVRLLLLGLTAAAAVYYLFVLAPEMRVHMREYWHAAGAGQAEAAARAKALFDADHPKASVSLQVTAGLLLVTFTQSVWLLARGSRAGGEESR